MQIDNQLVGQAIARFRELRGLTQSQLNDLVGMSTIQHIEQGRNAVSLTCLNKIADALDVPAACIMLLGSHVEKGDRVLSSLQLLLEKTMSLEAGAAPKKARRKQRSIKVSRVGQKRAVKAIKKVSKRQKAMA